MNKHKKIVFPLCHLMILVLLGFAGKLSAQARDWSPDAGYGFVCGLQNAEDLVLVPGTRWIISSGMAAGVSLYLINADSKEATAAYPAGPPPARPDSERYPECPGPPDPENFISHGLNLRKGEGGHSALFVVSHGGREAIEAFDVEAGTGTPRLTWIGCVPMPDGLAANSVASFSDGSLVATVLIQPGKTVTDAIAGRPTGAVYSWGPGDSGFRLVEGSELPANNGIEVSADDSTIFVASSGLRTITAFARANPTRVLRVTGRLGIIPDNVHMGPDGLLVTAGMSSNEPGCGGDFPPAEEFDLDKVAACPRGSIAYAIDPATMTYREIASARATPLFSNATMALPVGDVVWIGTFSGNRVGYLPAK